MMGVWWTPSPRPSATTLPLPFCPQQVVQLPFPVKAVSSEGRLGSSGPLPIYDPPLCLKGEMVLTLQVLVSLSACTLNSHPPSSSRPCEIINSSHSLIFNFSFSMFSYLSIQKHVGNHSHFKNKEKASSLPALPASLTFHSQASHRISIPAPHCFLHHLLSGFLPSKPLTPVSRLSLTFWLPNPDTFTVLLCLTF